MEKKWTAPILPYLAVAAGMFIFRNAWAALLGFHAAILLTLANARPAIPFSSLLKSRSPRRLAANILLGLLAGVVLYFLWDHLGTPPTLAADLRASGLGPGTWAPFILYFTLVNPPLEEVFWRVFLGSDARGFVPMDLVFAAYHLMILAGRASPLSLLLALACLVFIAWFWRQTAREDGGLLGPVLGHMAADLSILVCILLRAV